MNWYIEVIKKYAVFYGRATRSEFWYFQLFNTLIYIALMGGVFISIAIESLIVAQIMYLLMIVYGVAILIPNLAVTVRRLHDTGKSGWWYFIFLVPVVGVFILLFFLIQGSQPSSNIYGSDSRSNNYINGNSQQTFGVTGPVRNNDNTEGIGMRLVPENNSLPTISLTENPQIIGRSGEIVISNDYVSGKHLEIWCGMGTQYVPKYEYFISDLGSTNGTYINGEKLNPNESVMIYEGMRIILGSEDVVYRLQKI